MSITSTQSEEETISLAKDFLKTLPKEKNCICLFGDLGSGKTVFVKGIAKALGIEGYSIKSPTYTLIREYTHKKGKLIHIDLYRLEAADDLITEQIDEFLSDKDTLVVIEWADRMTDDLPEERAEICFEYIDEKSRKITVF
ncbi:tRNA (adenosine(37)-N6)-threonylcarbamoyltransferase complex ATPase subunit type 1 TsaE [Candidatus Peregrinibacteria bacterium]|jgi:tRNA threonylcarbamoyladenosine biosynthesis protein TsaE|nr:tRNA (adenosine(37)-N6)-threonylcarbamoyltransferase complex ATPase subunit type 1 TsaE [Candidatus Peregrinibacteria bacterium]MBT4056217.1 tRNA (adenosine(37)-N6)-threonylcarbamoyltransferase complex ATPase subunit type 1 TsaE [Candidatus Peregrinibacteria bacterium]